MEVEDDRAGAMVPGELEPSAPLHRREQREPRSATHDALQQSQVRQIVLDVEKSAAGLRGLRCDALVLIRLRRTRGRCVGARQLHHEGRALSQPAFDEENPVHGLHQTLRQREPEARALDARLLRAEPIEGREQSP